jgi:hypothetical protein
MFGVLVALAAHAKRIQLSLVFRVQILTRAFARFVYRLHQGLQHVEGLLPETLR